MTEKKDIISFKYHPNLYNNDVLKHSIGVCDCCGRKVEEYVESMYCKEKVKCICLQCISSGKAAKKFDGTFVQDAMPLDDTEKKEELFCRTPGYISWQGEYWLTCCNDYCAFVDNVGTKELEEYGIVYLCELLFDKAFLCLKKKYQKKLFQPNLRFVFICSFSIVD